MHHVLSAEQFSPNELGDLFERADFMRTTHEEPWGRRELATRYIGSHLISLFYEPSTRTRLSFEIGANSLGMSVAGTESAKQFSSVSKGETLEDTIHVLDEYNVDIIVLRHNEIGAAARAAAVSDVPIINAGDGAGEHPTQALTDLYTIQEQQGRLNNLAVTIGGDLKHGRTARSLAKLLAQYDGNSLRFISTSGLRIGDDIKHYLDEHDTEYRETTIEEAFPDSDVVYWTRHQSERITASTRDFQKQFVIDSKTVELLPRHATLMHPLPRVDEITTDVDSDPRAKYFRQAGNGLYVRMALIEKILAS